MSCLGASVCIFTSIVARPLAPLLQQFFSLKILRKIKVLWISSHFFCEMCFILFSSFLEITLILCWDFLYIVLEGNDCQNVTNPIFLNVTKTIFWFNKFLIKLNGAKWPQKKPSKGGGLWSLSSKWDIVSWKRVQTELYHYQKPNVEENRFPGLYYKMA